MSSVSTRYDAHDEADLDPGLTAATAAIRAGELVVLPTDTVYGIGADAFDAAAVARLLAAKGRGREMPPPVLIGSAPTLDALAVGLVTDVVAGRHGLIVPAAQSGSADDLPDRRDHVRRTTARRC